MGVDSKVFAVRGVPGLQIVDVIGDSATSQRLGQLCDLHRQYFPGYGHVTGEIMANATGHVPYPGCVPHQWLMMRSGEPVGFYLFDTNTHRAVVLRHFLAVHPQARAGLPTRWLGPLTERVAQVGQADTATATGAALLASASEIPADLFHHWRALGYRQLVEVDYAEPEHGMHWARHHREPQFLPITPNIGLTRAGADQPFAQVADAVLRGFLLDHYRLPPEHPRVAAILGAAQGLW